jgi:tetratricopeptide (TPR) repeat protein
VLQGDGAIALAKKFKAITCEMQKLVDNRHESTAAASEHDVSAIQESALKDARASGDIYLELGHSRGLGNTWIAEGNIRLDRGESEEAFEIATRAIALGAQTSKTVLVRGALLAAESAVASVEADVDCEENYTQRARECAELALKYAPATEPLILGRAHVWEARTRLLANPSPSEEERREIEHHRDEAQRIARKFHGCSLPRDLEKLQACLYPGGAAAATLKKWADDPSGVSFADLEACITRRAWQATRTKPGFKQLLRLKCDNKAQGLLERAGLSKMPQRQNASNE